MNAWMRSASRPPARRDRKVLPLEGGRDTVAADGGEILRVHEALQDLGRIDGDLARLVEMRYFAGLPVSTIAEAFGVTERTVERQWHKARAILFAALAR